MCASSDQYEKVCKGEFHDIKETLNRIDVSIRGNGKPGLNERVSLLESKPKPTGTTKDGFSLSWKDGIHATGDGVRYADKIMTGLTRLTIIIGITYMIAHQHGFRITDLMAK